VAVVVGDSFTMCISCGGVVYTGLIKERDWGLAMSEGSLDYYLNSLEGGRLVEFRFVRKDGGEVETSDWMIFLTLFKRAEILCEWEKWWFILVILLFLAR